MRIAIVGAGAAGLAAGRTLTGQGHEVVVYEKSNGLGGRAATRRAHDCVLDHGAQYLTLPDDLPALRRLVLEELPRDGLRDIGRPIYTFDKDGRVEPGDEARNAAPKWTYEAGLTTLGKYLAAGLEVRRKTRVTRLERLSVGYRLFDEAGATVGEADRVLVAIPAPQAADLLRASVIDADRRATALSHLERATYKPMFTFMFGYRQPPAGTIYAGGAPADPRPYYALVNTDRGHDISWLAVENDKGPSRAPSGVLALVAQMAVPFSEARYDDPPDELAAIADRQVRELLGVDLGPPLWHDHARWRYAKPAGTTDLATLNHDHDGLFFAGDYTTGWRLHLALQNGLDIAPLVANE